MVRNAPRRLGSLRRGPRTRRSVLLRLLLLLSCTCAILPGIILSQGWAVTSPGLPGSQRGSPNSFVPASPGSLNVSASSNVTSGPIPLAVQFSGSASGGTPPYDWSWNFGDGNSSSGQTVDHTFTVRGVFAVSLNVSDSQGNWSQAEVTIYATSSQHTPIGVQLWASPTSGPVPLTVNLTAQGTGCMGLCQVTFFMENANGSTNVGPDPGPSVGNGTNVSAVTTITSVGTWVISAVVQDQLGDNGSANVSIYTNAGPGGLVISASASPSAGSAPLLVTLIGNVTRGVGPYSASWSFGDGGNGTGMIIQHEYRDAGTYRATLRVVDSLNRSAAQSVAIVVSSASPGAGPLNINFSATPNLGPAPLNVTLNVSADGGSAPYALTVCARPTVCPVDESNWSGQAQLVTTDYPSPGNYTATATIQDQAGGQNVTTLLVSVLPPSVPDVSGSISARSGTSPLTISFTAIVSGGVPPFSIQWTFGDGSFGSSPDRETISHTYEGTGIYDPVLSVTELGGRVVKESMPTVTVAGGPGLTHQLLPSEPLAGGGVSVALAVAATVSGVVAGYAGNWLRYRRRLRVEGEVIVRSLEGSLRG